MSTHEISRTILVVEDSDSVRMVARRAIERLGLTVVEAENGEEALAHFDEQTIGLILLDVGLPDIDGFEVAERVRQHPRGAEVPIIVLTGNGDADSIRRAYAAGATDFAVKPVSWLILGQRLLFTLEAARRRVEIDVQRRELEETQRIARIGTWSYHPHEARLDLSSIARDVFALPTDEDAAKLVRQRIPRTELSLLKERIADLGDPEDLLELKHHLLDPDGGDRVVYTQARRVEGEGDEPSWIEGHTQDITHREQAEARVRYLAQHDRLTGLKNQDFFREALGLLLAQQRREGSAHALLVLNLDNFSRINEIHGREVGDEMLRIVAERLVEVVRETDLVASGNGTDTEIARIGSDEFSIVLARMKNPTDVARVARRILEVVRQPLARGSGEIALTARIGIAISPSDGDDVETLIANATAADRHAREGGGNRYAFYSGSMNESTRHRLGLESDFRQALLRKEIQVYYQPRVDMGTGRVIAAEALSRWQHAQQGWIAPNEFVQLAEESGLTFEFGRSVIETAMGQMRSWRERGYAPMPISINVSPTLLVDERLPSLFEEVVRTTGTPASLIEIEITETVLIRREEAAEEALGKLKALGLGIALDDFGTGYSALSHLQRFPVDVLKIDRSFTDALDKPDGQAIVRAVISMAHAMALRVVAEGVETLAQRSFLTQEGCDEEQGFLVSRPVPADEFEALFWPAGVADLLMDDEHAD